MPDITSILLVGNPQAGKFRMTVFDRVLARFHSRGMNVHEILDISSLPDRDIVRKKWDSAIVMGGDGKVNRFLNTLGPCVLPIGIIPVGIGNVFARELGIPLRDPVRAANIAMKIRRRAIDLGCVEGRYFLLMAGIGFGSICKNSLC
ncbi:MAG TPA: hypothetical protein ENG73_02775 [Desulfobacterales bacterium]|nr:hypothetical protein [Desulfobacterales bacterium]